MSDINEKLNKKANEMIRHQQENQGNDSYDEVNQILDELKSANDVDETIEDETISKEEVPNPSEKIDYSKLNEDAITEHDPGDADDIINERFNTSEKKNDNGMKKNEDISISERAKKYREQNAIIETHKKENVDKNNDNDPAETLFNTEELDKEIAERRERLKQYAEEDAKLANTNGPDKTIEASDIYTDSDSIDEIISEMNDSNTAKENDIEDPENLSTLLQKVEENKLYSTMEDNKELTGPSQYIIEENEDYVESIEDILESNNMRIVKASKKKKNAILDRFTNSGPQITMPLVNSGIFIKATGAGTSEIISMFKTSGNSVVREELNKLQHVVQHIVGSSIGRMELRQLIKVVSYYDKDTLFYALFAGTYPNEVELSRRCTKCGADFYVKTKTTNLLLNPEDFEKEVNDIRDNVTTYNRLIETSKLGKTYRKIHSNGLVIYYKHPSIDSYLTTLQVLSEESMNKYPEFADAAYCIDKIRVFDKDNDFIEYTDPNEILDLISKLKDTTEKYQIFDMIDTVRENPIPVFGFKECNCPNCGFRNPKQPFSIEDLLFIVAQEKEELASLKWAARMQKMKEMKKKSKATKN